MEKIEIGDSVIALSSNPDSYAQVRTKGKIYEVQAIRYCTKCGIQVLNIGPTTDIGIESQCMCMHVAPSGGLWWTISTEFRKLTNDSLEAIESEAVENEDYELAGIARDLQKA
jgi:hypothetical protein